MLHFIVCKGECQSRKKSAIIIAIFLRGGVGSEVTIALFILILKWPNSSRNAKEKMPPLVRGGGGKRGLRRGLRRNLVNVVF